MSTSSFNSYFPGYDILGEISRSNARVLKARHQHTGELAAIKHFNLSTDAETIRRFQRESEIMTSIRHPNIVKIREVRLEAELPYVVMDFIEGGDLRSLLKKKGSLDVTTVIRLGLQMMQAFQAIHEHGIIHRDIKPENIMFRQLPSDELHFLLTDFGIAKLREQSNTVTGTSLMTYEYGSPEQFLDPRSVSAATDYYAIGIVLYECLAGRVPFVLGEDGVYPFTQKVIHSSPPDLKLPSGEFIPSQLVTLVNGLLAKKQDERIKDAVTIKRMLKLADLEEPGNETQVVAAPLPVKVVPTPVSVQPEQPENKPYDHNGDVNEHDKNISTVTLAVIIVIILAIIGVFITMDGLFKD